MRKQLKVFISLTISAVLIFLFGLCQIKNTIVVKKDVKKIKVNQQPKQIHEKRVE